MAGAGAHLHRKVWEAEFSSYAGNLNGPSPSRCETRFGTGLPFSKHAKVVHHPPPTAAVPTAGSSQRSRGKLGRTRGEFGGKPCRSRARCALTVDHTDGAMRRPGLLAAACAGRGPRVLRETVCPGTICGGAVP